MEDNIKVALRTTILINIKIDFNEIDVSLWTELNWLMAVSSGKLL